MMDELKPCPKCESEDVNPIEAYVDEGLVRITCNECGFTTGAESDEETATAAWNTLFMMTAALRAELAELKAKWASVPWGALDFVVKADSWLNDLRRNELDKARLSLSRWHAENAPD